MLTFERIHTYMYELLLVLRDIIRRLLAFVVCFMAFGLFVVGLQAIESQIKFSPFPVGIYRFLSLNVAASLALLCWSFGGCSSLF